MTICRETKKYRIRNLIFIISFALVLFVYVSSIKEKEFEETVMGPYKIEIVDISIENDSNVILEDEAIFFETDYSVQEELVEEEKNETLIIPVTDSEYELLCKLVYAESGRKNDEEMVSIAATVLNRVANESFPNEIEDVIFQKNQFSTASNGDIYWYPVANEKAVLHFSEVSEEVKEAVNKALEGEDPTKVMVTNGTLFFYSDKYISEEEMAKREGKIKEFVKYGDTVFYREYSD